MIPAAHGKGRFTMQTETTPNQRLFSPVDIQFLRESKNFMRETDLLTRCRDAARREMRGPSFSSDERLDVASDIMVSIFSETKGAPPRMDDRRYSLTAICGKVANSRRSIEARRRREDEAADREAWTFDGLDVETDWTPEPISIVERSAMAELAVDRLLPDLATDHQRECVWSLFFKHASDITSEDVASQLGIAHKTLRNRMSEAAKLLRAMYPTPAHLLRRLVPPNEPRPAIDVDGSMIWLYGFKDMSSEAVHHGETITGRELRQRASNWRYGTNNGEKPIVATDASHADRLCVLSESVPSEDQNDYSEEELLQIECDSRRRLVALY
jgi:DNA-directed RNA polymerase specialized sigma24 family protein